MRLREHEGIQKGSLDMLRADPRHLIVQENYNVRDLTTPDALEKLQELADSIAEVGVKDPLLVRFDGENIIVVEGHRRLMATMMAIEAGVDIKSIPVYPEPQRINDAERDLGLIISNSGEPLTALEKAKVIGRLVNHGWSHQDIAKKCGWKSVGSVNQYLDMLGMPEAVKEQVRAGDLSATTARQIVKETAKDAKNDPEFAAKLIAANIEENRKIKGIGKSHKVTKTTLKRGKADKLPVPERAPRQGEIAEATKPTAEPATQIATEPARDEYLDGITAKTTPTVSAVVAVTATEEQFPTQVQGGYTAPPGDKPTTLPTTGSGILPAGTKFNGAKDLIQAVEPLAKAVADFDPEYGDEVLIFISDHGHEINAGQCRAAWKAWNAATGGSTEAEAA